MSPELSRRLADALNQHRVTFQEREQVVGAVRSTEEFVDLPLDIQQLVKDIEGRPGILAS